MDFLSMFEFDLYRIHNEYFYQNQFIFIANLILENQNSSLP